MDSEIEQTRTAALFRHTHRALLRRGSLPLSRSPALPRSRSPALLAFRARSQSHTVRGLSSLCRQCVINVSSSSQAEVASVQQQYTALYAGSLASGQVRKARGSVIEWSVARLHVHVAGDPWSERHRRPKRASRVQARYESVMALQQQVHTFPNLPTTYPTSARLQPASRARQKKCTHA